MSKYVLRRLLQMIPILFGITVLTFALAKAMPGDPFSGLINPNVTAQDLARLRQIHGLDDPLPLQYLKWLRQLLQGNLGFSFKYHSPVHEIIAERAPITFMISLITLLIGLAIGVPLGVISAVRQYSLLDNGLTFAAFAGISVPSFFIALLAIRWLAIEWRLFPSGGIVTPGLSLPFPLNYVDVLRHMILPAMVLGVGGIAFYMRYTRSSMLEVLRQDYVRTARAKGLGERVVIYRHALRNGLVPVITILGLALPELLGGAIITESIFSIPGMGQLSWLAVIQRDYPVIMAVTLLFAVLTVIGNLLADISYAWVDPRIRYD